MYSASLRFKKNYNLVFQEKKSEDCVNYEKVFRASRTSTVTVKSLLTITESTRVSVTCAKMVNITGYCRRRRGMWQQEPIVIFFDEDADQAVQVMPTFG